MVPATATRLLNEARCGMRSDLTRFHASRSMAYAKPYALAPRPVAWHVHLNSGNAPHGGVWARPMGLAPLVPDTTGHCNCNRGASCGTAGVGIGPGASVARRTCMQLAGCMQASPAGARARAPAAGYVPSSECTPGVWAGGGPARCKNKGQGGCGSPMYSSRKTRSSALGTYIAARMPDAAVLSGCSAVYWHAQHFIQSKIYQHVWCSCTVVHGDYSTINISTRIIS